MAWLTEAVVPKGTKTREYSSDFCPHFWAAAGCLEHGYADNAASWMWKDAAELEGDFKPVAGTLTFDIGERGQRVIRYVDVRDIEV